MQVLTCKAFRKDNVYFRTIEEREKINNFCLFCNKVCVSVCVTVNVLSVKDFLLKRVFQCRLLEV